MLSPARTKYRKQMKNRRHLRGRETRGTALNFGEYGLMALDSGWISNRQIEAARVALTRYIKRGGQVWLRIFPDKPVTKKPAEVRMGTGKGAPEIWVAVVKPGRILYEIAGVPAQLAQEALRLAGSKLCVRTRLVARTQYR